MFAASSDPKYAQPIAVDVGGLLGSLLPPSTTLAGAPRQTTLDGTQPASVLSRRRHLPGEVQMQEAGRSSTDRRQSEQTTENPPRHRTPGRFDTDCNPGDGTEVKLRPHGWNSVLDIVESRKFRGVRVMKLTKPRGTWTGQRMVG